MLQLGKRQELTVVKRMKFGVYLAEGKDAEERVLLPVKEVPDETEIGDRIEVFLYLDSKDRMIATRREPYAELGGVAVMEVKEVSNIGAFLDWGLEKDLLLPFKEQSRRVAQGEKVLAAVYLDKSRRFCATMNVYEYLETDSPYQKDDRVTGTIYETEGNFGVFVAVDNRYSGLIPKREAAGSYRIGDTIQVRVTAVKPDGKLDLSPNERVEVQMDKDAELVMKVIEEYEGVLPFGEKVSPEIIKREFGISKAAFKRAVGRLYKQGRIQIMENRIKKL
ncbi:S1 RNA-binding domain-containing protein [Hominisplanchenecus murintestinalis]|mgnify:FL=1|uniref:S1 RNA-binding domain-containing protein n=1 Tax=Hominisplanchenecus murintestinalis TaxID=2941517 RepID=A0AC61R1N9_9FIRM|nr:S1-like domain-containing RNA-binding protein [Hominisplanchenecus murintestinalis]NBH98570.1 S1 RNA-binding domain-containing protein [Lachnospiraceae bacterium]NBI75846.1 S1 RNA-binding domain-containing protein [Lachnospiraceae bacterium]RKJ88716.1 S1 RNA-binding domain-containing protein [Anaerotruncus sp. 1XD22-93]TGX99666.1 S1 RNA-binding domain-containing protein [Hominisplanchenecus murintestinalis]